MAELTEPQRLWVEALRSGDYEQTGDMLRDEFDRFCCLGVACDVAVKAGVISADILRGDDADLGCYPEVRKWLGLRTKEGNCLVECAATCLTSLNDMGIAASGPWSFERIAKLIEEQPLGLFQAAEDEVQHG